MGREIELEIVEKWCVKSEWNKRRIEQKIGENRWEIGERDGREIEKKWERNMWKWERNRWKWERNGRDIG